MQFCELKPLLQECAAQPNWNNAYLLLNSANRYLVELEESTWVERNLIGGLISACAAVEARGKRAAVDNYNARLQERAGKVLRHWELGQRSNPKEVYA